MRHLAHVMLPFLKRHQRKVLVFLGLSASAYWIYTIIEDKLREFKERIVLNQLSQEELEQQFRQNQLDANFTTLALLPTSATQIISEYGVEKIQNDLKLLKTQPNQSDQKGKMWHQIKIDSISRCFTLIYTNALLLTFVRVQLNLVSNSKLNDEVLSEFLSLSWWLLNKGWRNLSTKIRAIVEEQFTVDPTEELDFDKLCALIGKVHQQIDASVDFAEFMLPRPELYLDVLNQIPLKSVDKVDPETLVLVNKAKEVLDSVYCVEVVKRLVHTEISVFMSKVEKCFTKEKVRLAVVLMVATREAHQMGAGSPVGNEYVEAMVEVPELTSLCVRVFDSVNEESAGK